MQLTLVILQRILFNDFLLLNKFMLLLIIILIVISLRSFDLIVILMCFFLMMALLHTNCKVSLNIFLFYLTAAGFASEIISLNFVVFLALHSKLNNDLLIEYSLQIIFIQIIILKCLHKFELEFYRYMS